MKLLLNVQRNHNAKQSAIISNVPVSGTEVFEEVWVGETGTANEMSGQPAIHTTTSLYVICEGGDQLEKYHQ